MKRIVTQNWSASVRGFTLVELLVVIAIIGVLVALLLPAVQAAREAARRTQCANQLRQIALACQVFHDAHKQFPTTYSTTSRMSYLAQVLPYMEESNLRDLIDPTVKWSTGVNVNVHAIPVPEFQCPTTGPTLPAFDINSANIDEDSTGRAHYVGIMGAKYVCEEDKSVLANEPFPYDTYTISNCGSPEATGGQATNGVIVQLAPSYGAVGKGTDKGVHMRRVTDGTSNTMMIGEQSWDGSGPTRFWLPGHQNGADGWIYNSENVAYPMKVAARTTYPNNDTSLGSNHPGGAHVAMADGSVTFTNEDVELGVLRAMASRGSQDFADQAGAAISGGGGPDPPPPPPTR